MMPQSPITGLQHMNFKSIEIKIAFLLSKHHKIYEEVGLLSQKTGLQNCRGAGNSVVQLNIELALKTTSWPNHYIAYAKVPFMIFLNIIKPDSHQICHIVQNSMTMVISVRSKLSEQLTYNELAINLRNFIYKIVPELY